LTQDLLLLAWAGLMFGLQVDEEYGRGTLRLSVGRHTTAEEVDAAVGLIVGEAREQGVFGRV
jgi:cysteine sulfinate desulfinase/cysteine desulfurase-like protein